MQNPAVKKVLLVMTVCLSMVTACNAHAKLTVITGSYAHIENANKRIASPEFSRLGAFLLRTKSQQYAARVAVGCFDSKDQAKLSITDVLKAGAKGVWLLEVGDLCVTHKDKVDLVSGKPPYPASLTSKVVKKVVAVKKTDRPASKVVVKTKTVVPPSMTVAPMESATNPASDVAVPDEKPPVIQIQEVSGESSAQDAVTRDIELPQKPPSSWHPSKWLYKKGDAVAFTSGINPATFKQAKSNCYVMKNFHVKTVNDASPPPGIEDYEFLSDGNTCYIAYIYTAEGNLP